MYTERERERVVCVYAYTCMPTLESASRGLGRGGGVLAIKIKEVQ